MSLFTITTRFTTIQIFLSHTSTDLHDKQRETKGRFNSPATWRLEFSATPQENLKSRTLLVKFPALSKNGIHKTPPMIRNARNSPSPQFTPSHYSTQGRGGSAVGIRNYAYGLHGPRFEFRQGWESFLCSKTSIPALVPTRPDIQWVSGSFPENKSASALSWQFDDSLPSCAKGKNQWWLYFYPPLPATYAFMAWTGTSLPSPLSLLSYLVTYEGHLESKERFAIQRYLLIIGKKQNMQVLSHTFTYFST